MLKITTLTNTSFEQITRTFNKAFSDYYLPIVFTPQQFEEKFRYEAGRLDLSVGVFEDLQLVGLILHFVKDLNGERLCYNGGTGVIPAYRGHQFTSKMYDFILPKLKEIKVDKMVLEVLIQNVPAIKTYKRQGYKVTRELNIFKGNIEAPNSRPINQDYTIKRLKHYDWDLLQSFWDYSPTWQNSKAKLSQMEDQLLCFGAVKNDQTLAYLIYNPKSKRIQQMAVHKNHRKKGLGSALFNAVYSIEKEAITLINIDTRIESFKSFLEKKGLKHVGSQYEMECPLVLNS